MFILNFISDWKAKKYDKKVARMKKQGKCPDCEGLGVDIPLLNEFHYIPPKKCRSCNGSGLFSDWLKNTQNHNN